MAYRSQLQRAHITLPPKSGMFPSPGRGLPQSLLLKAPAPHKNWSKPKEMQPGGGLGHHSLLTQSHRPAPGYRGCGRHWAATTAVHASDPIAEHSTHLPIPALPRSPHCREPPGCTTAAVLHAAPWLRREKGSACPARARSSHSMPGSWASSANISQ